MGHLKVQLTEEASSAAACQQAAAAQVAQLRAEQLETILLLAKQLETMQTMRDIRAEDLVKFCSKMRVKLHECEDAHDEMSERKRFRTYGKLHGFIATYTDYLCRTVLADWLHRYRAEMPSGDLRLLGEILVLKSVCQSVSILVKTVSTYPAYWSKLPVRIPCRVDVISHPTMDKSSPWIAMLSHTRNLASPRSKAYMWRWHHPKTLHVALASPGNIILYTTIYFCKSLPYGYHALYTHYVGASDA